MLTAAILAAGLVGAGPPSAHDLTSSGNSLGAAWSQQQNSALRAVQQGRHVPLLAVVDKLQRRMGGRELDAGLERLNGQTVYRVRWTFHGRRTDYLVNAATGHVIGPAP